MTDSGILGRRCLPGIVGGRILDFDRPSAALSRFVDQTGMGDAEDQGAQATDSTADGGRSGEDREKDLLDNAFGVSAPTREGIAVDGGR